LIVEKELTTRTEQERPVRLMFQDEAAFGRISDPKRCWAPRGIRPIVAKQMVREYSYAYIAASPHDGLIVSLILPTVDAEAMSIFLAEVSRRHSNEFVLMFLDGAGGHNSNELIIPENIRIVQIPSHSPELNPVENLWDEIREKWFSNLVFDSLDAVEDRLIDALLFLEDEKELVSSITGFNWIINSPLHAT